MSRKENDYLRQQPQVNTMELSKIKEEIAFYRETIDYLMNRGMTFANCIRVLACMQLGDSFPKALLEVFSTQQNGEE